MTVMALLPTSFFAKCLRVGEDGPGRVHRCHIDIFLVFTRNGRFPCVVLGYSDTYSYFVQSHSDAPNKYSKADVVKMLEYLIGNIFFGVWQTDISTNNRHS